MRSGLNPNSVEVSPSMITQFEREGDVILVVEDTFNGTGVADLLVVEPDSKDALLPCVGESVENFVSVGDPGKGCVVVVTSPIGKVRGLESTWKCRVFIVNEGRSQVNLSKICRQIARQNGCRV
jgi:hypothetical protein